MRKEYEIVKTRLENGVEVMDASKKSTGLGKDYYLIKGGAGRYVVENTGDSVISVLGIADRGDDKSIRQFVKAMERNYDIKLKYKEAQ